MFAGLGLLGLGGLAAGEVCGRALLCGGRLGGPARGPLRRHRGLMQWWHFQKQPSSELCAL